MKQIFKIIILFSTQFAFSQRHSFDVCVLISNYTDLGGQNTNTASNNVLSYTSYGSLDFRLSYYYHKTGSKLLTLEFEGSRRSLPTNPSASNQFLSESYGLALAGVGREFKIDSNFWIRVLPGLSFMTNYIHGNATGTNQKYWFLSLGVSFGSDLVYTIANMGRRNMKKLYLKTGFRGSLELANINLKNNEQDKPKYGIASILVGTGVMF